MAFKLETVTEHYLIAMLWTETGDDDEFLDRDYGTDDVSTAARNTATGDCESFLELAASLIEQLPDSYTAEQFGHDFLLTRNGHGAGFWDRGLGDTGREFTQHANSYGDIHAFIDDAGTISTQ